MYKPKTPKIGRLDNSSGARVTPFVKCTLGRKIRGTPVGGRTSSPLELPHPSGVLRRDSMPLRGTYQGPPGYEFEPYSPE